MKIKVRIQKNNEFGTDRKVCQVLEHPYKDSNSINVIGYIWFRKFNPNEEYKLTEFVCESDKYQNFIKMGKIAKYIKENTYYDDSMKTVLNVVNAKEYKVFHHEFISVKDNGKNLYRINYINNEGVKKGWGTLIAANDIQAEKLTEKLRIKQNDISLTFELISSINLTEKENTYSLY